MGRAIFDFSGRRVVVTGGSRGIGQGIARRFLDSGASVSICGRSEKRIVEARKALGKIHASTCDITVAGDIVRYVGAAAAAMGGIDILVSNVSGFGRGFREEAWMAGIEADLLGAYRLCAAAQPWLASAQDAAIVHIGSITAFRPSRKAPAYGAVKAAMTAYMASQALELLPLGIRVNMVAPGSTESPGHFFEKRRLSGDPDYAAILASQPTGRMGAPEDIADVVLFAASDAARWMIGQCLIADGGQFINGG